MWQGWWGLLWCLHNGIRGWEGHQRYLLCKYGRGLLGGSLYTAHKVVGSSLEQGALVSDCSRGCYRMGLECLCTCTCHCICCGHHCLLSHMCCGCQCPMYLYKGSNCTLNHRIKGPKLWYWGCNGHGHGLYWKASVKVHDSSRLGGSRGKGCCHREGKTQVERCPWQPHRSRSAACWHCSPRPHR